MRSQRNSPMRTSAQIECPEALAAAKYNHYCIELFGPKESDEYNSMEVYMARSGASIMLGLRLEMISFDGSGVEQQTGLTLKRQDEGNGRKKVSENTKSEADDGTFNRDGWGRWLFEVPAKKGKEP